MKELEQIKEAIREYWGERCEEHYEGCYTCDTWKKYDELVDALRWKAALEAGGVDNWQWYSESLILAGYYAEKEI